MCVCVCVCVCLCVNMFACVCVYVCEYSLLWFMFVSLVCLRQRETLSCSACVKHLLLVTHVIRHVMFSLTDAPQTSVSISPPGDIQEGTDVTLTCTSTSDLPVRSYSWYKSSPYRALGSGKTYTIKHFRPEDSGEYYCWSEYECGLSYSSTVQLQVSCE